MKGETRTAVVLAAFSFARGALVGGAVVAFLALAGAIGTDAVLLYVGLVLAVALGLAIAAFWLARRSGRG